MVYWHMVVVLVNFYTKSLYIYNSQTSVELTANKMQNLLTKQEPEGVYNIDLHELQKNVN